MVATKGEWQGLGLFAENPHFSPIERADNLG
jgi:hypothetical protein